MISIVVPAHNEGVVIEGCLRRLSEGAGADELELIVVCNGCSDDTEERARGFEGPVRVLSMPVASKTAALNLGDRHAKGFPRFYVDADVLMNVEAIREVASVLRENRVLAAAPRAFVDLQRASWPVQAFYRVWTRLPYFDESMIGSGVYALSEKGRERFREFPDVIADDEFIRRNFAREERRRVDGCLFTITPPTRIGGVIREKSRSRLGLYQLALRFPAMRRDSEERSRIRRGALSVLRRPRLWPSIPVYLTVALLARVRARRRAFLREFEGWERDTTSRPFRGGP